MLARNTVSIQTDEPVYFVYLKGSKAPQPQIWFGNQYTGVGKFKHNTVGDPDGDLLFLRQLNPQEAQMTTAELQAKFPLGGVHG